MQNFDSEYYFLLKPVSEGLPSLDADADTGHRPYMFEQMPMGSAPLIFKNGFVRLQREQGTKLLDTPPDVMFNGSDLVVKDNIREALLALDIPNLVMNESIYIDHHEKWHENLWYLGFTQHFDCWDRQKSQILGGYDPEEEEFGSFTVERYVLNHAVMAETPLQQRLLFKMGKCIPKKIIAHYSVAKYFGSQSGVLVLPLSQFGDPDKIMTYI